MKGEILRRMSMEITKDDRSESDNPVKQDLEKETVEDEDDYLVKTIGAFGLWQAVVSVTVMLNRVVSIWNIMSLLFLIPITEFVCIEFADNITTHVNASTCYNNCVKYNYSRAVGRTIVEDFGLICQNDWLASFIQSVLMMGILFGASLFGWMSDKFGRRIALLLSTFLNAVFMVALPFSPTYTIFCFIRFMIGIATGGSMLVCVVQVMEIIGKRQREIAAACILIPDGLAEASLAGFAYFTSNWQDYTLSYGIVTCFIFVLMLFVPESPRWLVSNGKIDEAVKVVTRAANRNKLDTSNIKAEITKALENIKLKERENVKTSCLDFFKTNSLFIPAASVFILWFTLGFCFYGINQYVAISGIDLYLTVVILGLVQVPICPISIIINQRFGRRASTVGTTTGVALVTLIVIFIPKGDWVMTMFGVLALIFSNISFAITYIHVSELFPTPLRNMSYGLASCGAKIGAMIAPFVVNLSPSWLPSLVFFILSVVGSLCCVALPETKGQNLKDTIEKK